MNLLPAIIFLVGCFLAFATGTSWGTFGILIPIVVKAFLEKSDPKLMIISIAACMAGQWYDHCSPISDTTIMASAGAQCDHVNHVTTQLPYVITVAAVSFVTYLLVGFVQNAWITLPIGLALLIIVLLIIRGTQTNRNGLVLHFFYIGRKTLRPNSGIIRNGTREGRQNPGLKSRHHDKAVLCGGNPPMKGAECLFLRFLHKNIIFVINEKT